MTRYPYAFNPNPPPWSHQRAAFEATADLEHHALFMEQRCGKTRVALDTAAYHYLQGRITALVVVAPNGVHRQWVQEEAQAYLPAGVTWRGLVWTASVTPAQLGRWLKLVSDKSKPPELLIIGVNVDGLRTPRCQKLLGAVVRHHRFMLVVDESLDVGNPAAERSKVAVKLARRAAVRRILDGTPVAAGPLGLWNQAEVLSPGLLGSSYVAYRARYAVMEKVGMPERVCPRCHRKTLSPPCPRCGGTGWDFYERVAGYQNLAELEERVAKFSTRVRRADCHDQPPKLYVRRPLVLTPKQRQVYDELTKTYQAQVADGQVVIAAHVLTRYLRLQQVTSNHAPTETPLAPHGACGGDGCLECDWTGWGLGDLPEEKTVTKIDPDHDPRLESLLRDVQGLPAGSPFIVWARFVSDVDLVCSELTRLGLRVGRYDGQVKERERNAVKLAFQAGELDALVGSSRAGGRGLDLSRADTIYYYSHDWSLRARLQSEDRGESLKKARSTAIVDLVAVDTVDEKILGALREGKSLGQQVMGDPRTTWF